MIETTETLEKDLKKVEESLEEIDAWKQKIQDELELEKLKKKITIRAEWINDNQFGEWIIISDNSNVQKRVIYKGNLTKDAFIKGKEYTFTYITDKPYIGKNWKSSIYYNDCDYVDWSVNLITEQWENTYEIDEKQVEKNILENKKEEDEEKKKKEEEFKLLAMKYNSVINKYKWDYNFYCIVQNADSLFADDIVQKNCLKELAKIWINKNEVEKLCKLFWRIDQPWMLKTRDSYLIRKI